MAGELAMGEQPVQCALQIAPVVRDRAGDIAQNRRRHIKTWMMRTRGLDTGRQNLKPQFFSKQTDLDHQPAGQARAYPLVKAFKFCRRPICRYDHLAATVDERVESV